MFSVPLSKALEYRPSRIICRWTRDLRKGPTPPSTLTTTTSSPVGPPVMRFTDDKEETERIIAYLIVKSIGEDFSGSDKLVAMAAEAPDCAFHLFNELQHLPEETKLGIRALTDGVVQDARSYKHHIARVYREFIHHSNNYEPGNPSFGMLMSIITYLVELCRGFLESGNGMEIYSIHGHAVRLMINPETPLSPVNWTEYCKSHPRKDSSQVTTRGDRRSALVEGVTAFMNLMNAYHKYTK